jgi:hypothetical protein
MSEHAIKIEGFDELTHLPVRIQLTLVTNDEPGSGAVATGFAAPRGFLPEQARPAAHAGSTVHSTVPAHDRAQHSRHTGLTGYQTQVWGGGAGRGDVAQ